MILVDDILLELDHCRREHVAVKAAAISDGLSRIWLRNDWRFDNLVRVDAIVRGHMDVDVDGDGAATPYRIAVIHSVADLVPAVGSFRPAAGLPAVLVAYRPGGFGTPIDLATLREIGVRPLCRILGDLLRWLSRVCGVCAFDVSAAVLRTTYSRHVRGIVPVFADLSRCVLVADCAPQWSRFCGGDDVILSGKHLDIWVLRWLALRGDSVEQIAAQDFETIVDSFLDDLGEQLPAWNWDRGSDMLGVAAAYRRLLRDVVGVCRNRREIVAALWRGADVMAAWDQFALGYFVGHVICALDRDAGDVAWFVCQFGDEK